MLVDINQSRKSNPIVVASNVIEFVEHVTTRLIGESKPLALIL